MHGGCQNISKAFRPTFISADFAGYAISETKKKESSGSFLNEWHALCLTGCSLSQNDENDSNPH
jgi:hypothetical protein